MITVKNTSRYSMSGASEMAYQIEYSDGTKVRAVESVGRIIRRECMLAGAWVLAGKPYVIVANKKRQAEKIKAIVEASLKA